MTAASLLVGLFFLAGLVEFVAERLFGTLLSGTRMIYVATILGVAVALIFKVGIIQSLGISGIDMSTAAAEWADYALTGLLIGTGSNKLHEFISKYLAK